MAKFHEAVEEFIDFKYEITLLTVTQQQGETLFCAPIGHVQERGDYQQSWQPCPMKPELLEKAKVMAAKVTEALGGAGIFGVEFFIGDNDVWFSELSPRPHDTGMVTLAQTQNLNQFDLHARAILGLPIAHIEQLRSGASSVLLARDEGDVPEFLGINEALKNERTSVYVFGKPTKRPYRRMGVVLVYDEIDTDIQRVVAKAKSIAETIKVL